MNILKNKTQLLVTSLFIGFLIWWASFQSVIDKQGLSVQWYGSTYGVLALIGAVIGFNAALKWGGFKTVLGKSLMLFSAGLLAQEAGQLIYTYYIVVAKSDVPYPSIGDIAYFGSVILYIAAAINLCKAAGVKIALKEPVARITFLVVPAILLSVSFFVLLSHHKYDTSNPLSVLLDFGYPVFQALYISLALTAYLLSRKLLGGFIKPAILTIILALVVQYVSDFTFVFQNSRGSYLPGKYADLLYLISYFVMSTALLRFSSVYANIRDKH